MAPPSSGGKSDSAVSAYSLCFWCLSLGGPSRLGGDFVTDPGKELLPTLNVNC